MNDILFPPKNNGLMKQIINNKYFGTLSENKNTILEYLCVLLISFLFTFYIFRSLHPTIPMAYAVDEVMFTSIFKVMLETGTPSLVYQF